MTDTNIANVLLVSLGAERISDINDSGSENARKVKSVWELALRITLHKNFWNHSTREVRLAKTATVPVLSDFSACFQLPSDFIRLKKTSLDETDTYKIKGSMIYCNSTSLSIEYVWYNTDSATWDPSFIEAFVLQMASMLGYSISGSAALKQTIDAEKKTATSNAMSINSQQGTVDKPRCGSWVKGR